MREIVFDTETTGLSFSSGDRLVEIGCVEMFNRVETGRTYHAYFNPGRAMPAEAFAVHGLSEAFLSDKPRFEENVEALLEFLGDSPLIAHNAMFDYAFLCGELGACQRAKVPIERIVDTLGLARTKHPGAKHSLDALCTRYGIDRSHRVLHGALLDAQLLAQVYVELTGGRQIGLGLAVQALAEPEFQPDIAPAVVRPPRLFAPSEAELAAHAAFMKTFANPLWGAEANA